ncbi:DNA-binding transcriptional LysR family regulator [Oxalobacteraceae bacterium GrIS 1.11]
MIDLKSYVVLAEVVGSGSMSAAARRLGLTPSAISQIITGLERRSGVVLLHRSTRKISLTEAGERCYAHCLRLVDAANAATASLEQARDAPTGELRIAAPLGFGNHVAPAMAPVLAEWPQLRLRLIVDDAMIDLVASRIDIALRVGSLVDSNWVGRKLCDLDPILCASPAYIERHGMPDSPSDLCGHNWLGLTRDMATMPSGNAFDSTDIPQVAFDLVGGQGREERIIVPLRTSTTNQIALQQMCEQGMGIARLFEIDVRAALERGALIRVLPQLRLRSHMLTMLTPSREGEPAKVRVTLAALKHHFASVSKFHNPLN